MDRCTWIRLFNLDLIRLICWDFLLIFLLIYCFFIYFHLLYIFGLNETLVFSYWFFILYFLIFFLKNACLFALMGLFMIFQSIFLVIINIAP